MPGTPSDSSPPSKQGALACLQAGRWHEARERLTVLCASNGGDAEAWLMLAAANGQLGLLDECIACCAQAVTIRPDYAEAYYNLAQARMHQGDYAAAAAAYEPVTRLQPGHVTAWNNLGYALQQLRELDKAEQCYRDAIRLNPWDDAAYFNLGVLLLDRNRLTEAAASLRDALTRRSDRAETHVALGKVLAASREFGEAERCYQRALEVAPESFEARRGLATALLRQGRLDEAERYLREALRRQPDSAELLGMLSGVLFNQGHQAEAVAITRQRLQQNPESVDMRVRLCFQLLHSSDDPALILKEHRLLGGRFEKSASAAARHNNSRTVNRRLRIGYVSADFIRHAAAGFIEPIIAHHDPEAIECFCYSNVSKPDEVTGRLKAAAHAWREIRGLSDEEAAERVRADGIDILVDLSGYTGGHRMGLFALKPAPVQISFLGYPATTGLEAIDYYLTDAIADPPGAENYYVERLLRLDRCFICYAPPAKAPDVVASPVLTQPHITFGSFNKLSKMGPGVIELWARLLRAVPGSRLLILRHELQEGLKRQIRERFAREGLDPARVEIRNTVPLGHTHLWAYGQVDIMLDTFPWNGHVTTCEALWMGVPVITLYGRTHAGRMAASVLRQLDLWEWVALNPRDYVRIAVKMARDREGLARLRAQLRERMHQSLCDGKAYTRSLEAAYRQAWRHWCEGGVENPGAGGGSHDS